MKRFSKFILQALEDQARPGKHNLCIEVLLGGRTNKDECAEKRYSECV